MQRPAAVEQLKVLGEQLEIPVFTMPSASPLEICEAAVKRAYETNRDVVIFDTAGRLAIDEPLMEELDDIKKRTKPNEHLPRRRRDDRPGRGQDGQDVPRPPRPHRRRS